MDQTQRIRREQPPALDEILALRCELAGLRVIVKGLALLRLLPKANFNPAQPRVPAGNPDGGEWAPGSGGAMAGDDGMSRLRLTITPLPRIGDNGGPPMEEPPEIPTRPSSQRAQLRAVVRVALWAARIGLRVTPLAGVLIAAEAAYWIYQYYPWIEVYLAEPAPLHELQGAVSTPQPGTDVHHIVEQSPARADGFPDERIEAPENRVRISRLKHWEITSWYATRNEQYGGQSPRDYLRGKDWDTRVRVGRDKLIKEGVLKP